MLELVGERGRAFLKGHAQPRKFEQERRAYDDWCSQLVDVPRLVAAKDDEPWALVLSACDGATLQHESLAVDDELVVYERAGRWLARLHALPHDDGDALSPSEAIVARTKTWCARGASVVSKRERDGVLAIVTEAAAAGALDLPRVPCHRDFTRRNWLWDGESLTVIDFEHAGPDLHVVDVERLVSSVPEDRDDLIAAFEQGYGRTIDADREALRAMSAMSALSRVVWATEHDDEEFERRGRAQLTRTLA